MGTLLRVVLGVLLMVGAGASGFATTPDRSSAEVPVCGELDSDALLAVSELSYEVAASSEIETDFLRVEMPSGLAGSPGPYYEQDSVHEAAALVSFVTGLQQATAAYFADLIAHCDAELDLFEVVCPGTEEELGMTCEEYLQQEREYFRLRCLGEAEIPLDVDAGLLIMSDVEDFLASEAVALGPEVLAAELELAAGITANMATGLGTPPYRDEGEVPWSSPGVVPIRVTLGGPQDFGYIRTVVAEGYVPLPFHLAVDGLFAEHDLTIETPQPCQQLLCTLSAVGYAPVLGADEPDYFVQIGFATGLDAESWQREPVNLAVVVDKSGSMGDVASLGDELSKMAAVRTALQMLVDRLDERDRLAIVVFDSDAQVLVESTEVTDPEQIKSLIDTIYAGGSTCIECGLQLGFEIVAQHLSEEDLSEEDLSEEGLSEEGLSEEGLSEEGETNRINRVILFTDALPNTGRTGQDTFLGMAGRYGEMGIGLTTFGVGANFGQELALAISRLPGGNYFFLENAARIVELFTLDFDYLVSPLAYDLRIEMEPAVGFAVEEVYGIDTWRTGSQQIVLDVPTLFPSRSSGAILLRLVPLSPRSAAGRVRH